MPCAKGLFVRCADKEGPARPEGAAADEPVAGVTAVGKSEELAELTMPVCRRMTCASDPLAEDSDPGVSKASPAVKYPAVFGCN